PPPKNVALHRRTIATSFERAGLEPARAVDGNFGTRWASKFSDPQFIIVDLDSTRQIESVWLYWEAAYAKEYKIQISDDLQHWQCVYHDTSGTGGIKRIPVNAAGRYVQMYGIKRATQWGYSLYEMEIYLSTATGIGSHNADTTAFAPRSYVLHENYPNPFNPRTTVEYAVPTPGPVRIQIFDALGRLVATLVDRVQEPGTYRLEWQGRNAAGQAVASGLYFLIMHAQNFTQVRKMLLLR
ncbi:MAG: T9SS C-terminal target domain-containing protein, partial [Calditrichaeota bacterium]